MRRAGPVTRSQLLANIGSWSAGVVCPPIEHVRGSRPVPDPTQTSVLTSICGRGVLQFNLDQFTGFPYLIRIALVDDGLLP